MAGGTGMGGDGAFVAGSVQQQQRLPEVAQGVAAGTVDFSRAGGDGKNLPVALDGGAQGRRSRRTVGAEP